jgi:hypothetical protein
MVMTQGEYDLEVRKAALEEAVYATISEFASLRSAGQLAAQADLDDMILQRAALFEDYLRQGGATLLALRRTADRIEVSSTEGAAADEA